MKRQFFVPSVLLSFLLLISCQKDKNQENTAKSRPPSVISAYTSGIISSASEIKILFNRDIVDSSRIGKTLEKSPFSFSPAIKGSATWQNRSSLVFKPEARLPSGVSFEATLALSQFMESIEGKNRFSFSFSTIKQGYEITFGGLQTNESSDMTVQQYTGTITTADAADDNAIEKMISAVQSGKKLPVQWGHNPNKTIHTFTVDSIRRSDEASSVEFTWSGAAIGVDMKGSDKIIVPSLSSFVVNNIKAVQGAEQYIEIRFSDPLKKQQNLKGLITVSENNDLQFSVSENIVKVYTKNYLSGSLTVTVNKGVKNNIDRPLKEVFTGTVSIENIKPEVKFLTKGIIIPSTEGVTIPIEAVNLKAVIVEARHIFDHNMAQFMQVNEFDGTNELRRVGKVVWKKRVNLNFTPDKTNKWIRYGLDCAPLVKNFPGGMFRLRIYFKKNHAVYHCLNSGEFSDSLESSELEIVDENLIEPAEEKESSSWDSYEGEYSDGESEGTSVNYAERNDPCSDAYYQTTGDHTIEITRNILISDIGIIAKSGKNDSLFVVLSDIKTVDPLEGGKVVIIDYQQDTISSGVTDKKGCISLYTKKRKPFMVLVQHGSQYGYLKIKDGDALSVSQFDVSGDHYEKGIKGFIYGERGVWRPGDSLFLTFVLNDNNNPLPPNHPVILEVMNSRNQKVTTLKQTEGINGFYVFKVPTSPDAPTGNWNATVKVGGVTFSTVLKVETVMPNRLKINLDLGKDVKYLSEGDINMDLSSTWLHGAIARNLDCEMEVSFASIPTQFSKFSDYLFSDPARSYKPESREIFKGTLDENGKAAISTQLTAGNESPGMLQANFTTRVYENGGAFSTDRFSKPFHPYNTYIGIKVPKGDKARGMLLTDTLQTIDIVALDKDEKFVSSAKVEIMIYKIEWRWWWEKGPENVGDYTGSSSRTPIKCDTVKIVNGTGKWQFMIKYPDWGRYLIRARDIDGGHATGKVVYIDWPGWAGRAQKEGGDNAAALYFSAEKNSYDVGEDVTISIPTAIAGRGLVCIENGRRIVQADWLSGTEGYTKYTFKATPQMCPNVYVNVTYLQPHLQTKNDLPIRMYGIIPVAVSDPQSHLKPVVKCKDSFEPLSKEEIEISEENGSEMTYTLAIVDEGLLGLTRFQTPDPWGEFFKRETHGITTWDLYNLVSGAYGGKLEQLLAIGGDEAAAKAKSKANRFPPMVVFQGPFTLKGGKTNKHTIDMPQYIGAVRVMAVAGNKTAYGCGDKSVFVKKPLMLLATLPRIIGPGEEVALPVSVFALEDKIKNVNITVETDGPIDIVGDKSKKVTFQNTGDKLVNFSLKTRNIVGQTKVTITATGNGEKISQTIDLEIRLPNWPVTDVYDAVLEPGKQWNQKYAYKGIDGTRRAWLEFSRIKPMNLGDRLKSLIMYPHGCFEQTTSSLFPQVRLKTLLDLSNEQRNSLEGFVKAGINRMRSFQISSGAFGYWQGDVTANDWGTNYAGHFLLQAQKEGYYIPQSMMSSWLQYQRQRAQTWSSGNQLDQAYRLFTLALAGSPDLGAMNRLKESSRLTPAAKWRLAGAYELAGHSQVARDLVRGLPLNVDKYQETGDTYGSDARDKAMILETLVLMKDYKQAKKLADELAEALSQQMWYSTQSTAYMLIALAQYSELGFGPGELDVTWSYNGGKEQKTISQMPISQIDLPVKNEKEGTVQVTNNGKTPVYVRMVTQGTPLPSDEKKVSNGLDLSVTYLDEENSEISIESIEQGTDFIAQVVIRNNGQKGRTDEIALSHIFPAGWEIRNARLDGSEQNQSIDFQDIRDDRIYSYFDLNQGESKTISYRLNAAYLGNFYMPTVIAEAMYDATINGRVPGQWVKVVIPETDEKQ